MTDGGIIFSWGADGELNTGQLVAGTRDPQAYDPGHPREGDLRSVSDEDHKIGVHPCLKCRGTQGPDHGALGRGAEVGSIPADEYERYKLG